VTFGEVAVTTFQSETATQIVLTAPAGAAGAVDVIVATAGGASAASVADQFTTCRLEIPGLPGQKNEPRPP
jgi:hypothetical protein